MNRSVFSMICPNTLDAALLVQEERDERGLLLRVAEHFSQRVDREKREGGIDARGPGPHDPRNARHARHDVARLVRQRVDDESGAS